MIRKEAIKIATEEIGDQPIVAANGFISRDLFESNDKTSNFYMIGSMGLASSIGLGIALKNPKKRIFVFDGDGNLLMNLGTLITIGSVKPQNFVHLVFDNNAHESTGGQPTNSKNISLSEIAKATNYRIFKVNSVKDLRKVLHTIKKIKGPIMVLINIEKSEYKSKRVEWTPKQITKRFSDDISHILS
jgi:sulfopyruvate decarboxylase subunit beta